MSTRSKRARITYEIVGFGENPLTIVRRARHARLWIESYVPVGGRQIAHSFGIYFNESIGKYVICDINIRGGQSFAKATAGWTLKSPRYLSVQRKGIMRLIAQEGYTFAPFASAHENEASELAHADLEKLGIGKLSEGACGNYVEAFYNHL